MRLTLGLLLEEGGRELERAGIGEALLDARYLLLEAFHEDMAYFLIKRNQELPGDDKTLQATRTYWSMIIRRSERVPLSQIIGSRAFMGLDFMVNEHVLIPRQDTETLVEAVLKDYKGKNASLLDLCTGSGCIAVSLAVLGGFARIVAADISLEALEVASYNARQLLPGTEIRTEHLGQEPWRTEISNKAGQSVRLIQSDFFEALSTESPFDVIVSNPPYIPSQVISGLEPEVREHEPMLALDGGEDGLYFYRRLANEAGRYLKPGGGLYFEIGYDQADAVSSLLSQAGFEEIRVIKDAPGLDRVVKAGKRIS